MDGLNIKSKHEILEIRIVNTLGQLIVSQAKQAGIKSIDISKLNNGVYYLKLKDREGNTTTEKIWKY